MKLIIRKQRRTYEEDNRNTFSGGAAAGNDCRFRWYAQTNSTSGFACQHNGQEKKEEKSCETSHQSQNRDKSSGQVKGEYLPLTGFCCLTKSPRCNGGLSNPHPSTQPIIINPV